MTQSPPGSSINTVHGSVEEGAQVVQVYAPGAPAMEAEEFVADPSAAVFSPDWLQFHQARVPLLARESELSSLQAFLDDTRPFLWWACYGPAGAGKSRLALEAVSRNADHWDGGFVSSTHQKVGAVASWVPTRDTFWVFDYAAANCDNLVSVLKILVGRYRRSPYRVRLLLLERNAGESSGWWSSLIEQAGHQAALLRASLFREPLELRPLGKQCVPLLASWLRAASWNAQQIERELASGSLDELYRATDGGRPLLVALVAAELWHGTPLTAMKGRLPSDNLDAWILRELRLMRSLSRNQSAFEGLCRTLLLTTYVGGVTLADEATAPAGAKDPEAFKAAMRQHNLNVFEALAQIVEYPDARDCLQRLEQVGISRQNDWCLRPDALGEHLMQLLLCPSPSVQKHYQQLPLHDPERLGRLLYLAQRLGGGHQAVLARLDDDLLVQALALIARHDASSMRFVLITIRHVAVNRQRAFSKRFIEVLHPALWKDRFDPIVHEVAVTVIGLSQPERLNEEAISLALKLFDRVCQTPEGSQRLLWLLPFMATIAGLQGRVLHTVFAWHVSRDGLTQANRAREVILSLELIERIGRGIVLASRHSDGSFRTDVDLNGFAPNLAELIMEGYRQCLEASARLEGGLGEEDLQELGSRILNCGANVSYALLAAEVWPDPWRRECLRAAASLAGNAPRFASATANQGATFVCGQNMHVALDLLSPGDEGRLKTRLFIIGKLAEVGEFADLLTFATDGVLTAARTGNARAVVALSDAIATHAAALSGHAATIREIYPNYDLIVGRLLEEKQFDGAFHVVAARQRLAAIVPQDPGQSSLGDMMGWLLRFAIEHCPERVGELTRFVEEILGETSSGTRFDLAGAGAVLMMQHAAIEMNHELVWPRVRCTVPKLSDKKARDAVEKFCVEFQCGPESITALHFTREGDPKFDMISTFHTHDID